MESAEGSSARPWGKCSPCGASHPLSDHCLDVASVLRALLDCPAGIRGNVPPDAGVKDRLAVIAFLHDFGKCNRSFQAKADPAARDTAGHVMEAAALLLELQDRWPPAWTALIGDLCGWFASEEQAFQMLLASISHHGRPVSVSPAHAGIDPKRIALMMHQGFGPPL